jgi:hypothetical protein
MCGYALVVTQRVKVLIKDCGTKEGFPLPPFRGTPSPGVWGAGYILQYTPKISTRKRGKWMVYNKDAHNMHAIISCN